MPARLAFVMMADIIQRDSGRRDETSQEEIDYALREPGAEDERQERRRRAIEMIGGEIHSA